MSGPEGEEGRLDEFAQIERLYRPLTRGAPEALRLLDDAAVIPQRAGFDFVVTKDAMVEGVHFPVGEPADLVARKLLRVNLSDLAAMGAEPYGYLLATVWPKDAGLAERTAFAEGLRIDGEAFGLSLLGGDTVSTDGPRTFSLTLLGWVPHGSALLRSGARPGDRVLVSGPIGDGWLGLEAVFGRIADPTGELTRAYRLPDPRLDLAKAARAHASAGADISDGLIADAGHIAKASGVGLELHLDRLPLSEPAKAWLAGQPNRAAALVQLASGGDDYELVLTAAPLAAAELGLSEVGVVSAGEGMRVLVDGAPVEVAAGGWRHPPA